MTTFVPANLELNEFSGTTGFTIQIVPATATPPALQDDLTIVSVTSSGMPSDFQVTWHGDTFTFSSSLNDMFDRTLKYLKSIDENGNKTYKTASRFNDIDDEYIGIFQYVPPSVEYIDIPFTIVTEGTESGTSTHTWTLTVRYDSSYSNSAFTTLVRQGKEYQNALSMYPEMSI